MSIFEHFEVEETAKIEIDANRDGTIPTFHISRMASVNKKYQRCFEAKTKPYSRKLAKGKIEEEVEERLWAEIFVESVLQDWENVRGRDGNDIPFSKEAALEVMLQIPELCNLLQNEARNIENFRAEEEEEEAGN